MGTCGPDEGVEVSDRIIRLDDRVRAQTGGYAKSTLFSEPRTVYVILLLVTDVSRLAGRVARGRAIVFLLVSHIVSGPGPLREVFGFSDQTSYSTVIFEFPLFR